MDRKPGLSRLICLRRQPGIGQSLFMLRSMGSDASPFKHQRRPAQSTQTAGEPFCWGNVSDTKLAASVYSCSQLPPKNPKDCSMEQRKPKHMLRLRAVQQIIPYATSSIYEGINEGWF